MMPGIEFLWCQFISLPISPPKNRDIVPYKAHKFTATNNSSPIRPVTGVGLRIVVDRGRVRDSQVRGEVAPHRANAGPEIRRSGGREGSADAASGGSGDPDGASRRRHRGVFETSGLCIAEEKSGGEANGRRIDTFLADRDSSTRSSWRGPSRNWEGSLSRKDTLEISWKSRVSSCLASLRQRRFVPPDKIARYVPGEPQTDDREHIHPRGSARAVRTSRGIFFRFPAVCHPA